jgi:alanine racemase
MPLDASPLHEATLDLDATLRPTYLEVDLGQLRRNYQLIAAHVGGAPVMPVLKANAYGHGLVAVGRVMEAMGAPCIGVAYLEEGLLLRRAGIRTPVLIMGGILAGQIPLFLDHDLTLTASSVDKLAAIDAVAQARGVRARVHLKIDTGMERIGIHWDHADRLIAASLRCRNVDVEGVFSHLATADESDPGPTRLQLERFLRAVDYYPRHSLPTPIRHLANSGGVLQHPDTWLDMVRPGILLFGVMPSSALPRTLAVLPALTWLSRVVYFKVVEAGSPVSYGGTWAPAQRTRLVTVPVGYGDGYMRRMQGQAQVIIRGRRYPVVGRICMDQVMVDIGWDSAWNDDPVVLLGASRDGGAAAPISAEEVAGWADTIPYEVLTSINTRVPRVYVET